MTDGVDRNRLGDDPAHGLGPMRTRVLSLLQDAGESMTAATVGTRLGSHVNSARFHLDALVSAGLVVRHSEERSGPGRPRMLYAAAGQSPQVAHRSYRLLAEMLAGFLSDQLASPAEAARGVGEGWGRRLAEHDGGAPGGPGVQGLGRAVAALQRVGFESHVAEESGSLRLEIGHCPFLEVAKGHLDVVCSMHLGLIRGLLEEAQAPVRATRLDPLVAPSRCIAHLVATP